MFDITTKYKYNIFLNQCYNNQKCMYNLKFLNNHFLLILYNINITFELTTLKCHD